MFLKFLLRDAMLAVGRCLSVSLFVTFLPALYPDSWGYHQTSSSAL